MTNIGRRRIVAETVTTYPQKITFGEMRESGVRDVLIYCRDHRCGHHIEINANMLTAGPTTCDCRTSSRSSSAKCRQRGGEIRPNFGPAKMGSG